MTPALLSTLAAVALGLLLGAAAVAAERATT